MSSMRRWSAHGSGDGCASLTIQLARQQGVAVVGTRSDANQDYLGTLGATPVVYRPGLIARMEQARSDIFDASIDMAGTAEATDASLARVKADGLIGSIAAMRPSSERVRPIMRRRDPARIERVVAGVVASCLK